MKNDFFEYKLTRAEFAKSIGKSREAVRSAMRRGQYADCYRFDGTQYLFKSPDRPRVNIERDHGHKTIPKRQINRGNHYKANYPNEAFRAHNERKILAKLNKTDPEFVKKVPELEKIYQEQKAKRINVNLENTKIKNYGGMIRGLGTPENSQVFVRPLREREPECKSFFIGRVACDHTETGEWEDAAVEFTPQDLDQHDRNKPFEERTSFSSKVEESIYRAKLDLLRKKGGWD